EIELDRNRAHEIMAVVDRLVLKDGVRSRVAESVEAALQLDRAGYPVVLVEKEGQLGGRLRELSRLFPGEEPAAELLGRKLGLVERSSIKVLTGARLVGATRLPDGFAVSLLVGASGEERLLAAAVILAVGYDYFDVREYGEYGCGIYPGVIDSRELEQHLRKGDLAGLGLQPGQRPAVAFIQCVGSRDRAKGRAYCSRICCLYSTRQARQVREILPQSRVYVFYMDVRAAGRGYEEYYRRAMEESGVFYLRGRPSKVFPAPGRLLLRFEDTLMGTPGELEVDLVVLAGAMLPARDGPWLAEVLGLGTDGDGFFCGSDCARPLMAGERVFFAGACGFPVSVEEAIIQGAAAASEAAAILEG
ncbi:MAG: hypothetical protein QHH02_08015, partial [Syntrophomonadaceae bacterium]|nr:hypothetical protein [Syntrophomonadaceae bacterium]